MRRVKAGSGLAKYFTISANRAAEVMLNVEATMISSRLSVQHKRAVGYFPRVNRSSRITPPTKLDRVVQNTLLAETMQEGVQQALQRYMNMKATIEETAASKNFHEMVLKEIYRERGKTLPKNDQA